MTYRHLEGATRDSKAFWNLYARMSSSAPAMLPDMLLEDGTIVSDGPLLREKWADHFRAQGTPNTPTTREAESFQNAVRILLNGSTLRTRATSKQTLHSLRWCRPTKWIPH